MKGLLAKTIAASIRLAGRIPIIGDAIVKASFDAVRQNFGERSLLFQSLTDAWIEIDACTRKELQRTHESLIENSYLVQKIRNLYVQFSAGPSGLIVTPNATLMDGPENSPEEVKGVESWNQSRAVSWERWWRNPELNSDISGSQLTRQWSGQLFDKGEIFVILLPSEKTKFGVIPRIQTVDAHRCETPGDTKENNGNQIIDGKEVDSFGKVIAYWFKRANYGAYNSKVTFDRVEAFKDGKKQVIHKFKYRRPGQIRGIPEGFSVYNLVRDNMDLHKLEMGAAKLASEIGNVEINASGEVSTYANRQARMGFNTQTASGASKAVNFQANYKVSMGAKNIALQHGDSLKQFMIDRPTVATQAYWDLHNTVICVGYNVPRLLVLPISIQGTVARADLDVSGYGFGREHFEIIRELLCEIYEWQTEWAIKFDRSLDGQRPQDYQCCHIRPPRAPNVDVGYNANAEDVQLRNGTKTIQDVYAERQQDWRDQVVQQAEYLKFVKETAAQYGVEPSQITNLMVTESSNLETETDEKEPEQKEKETIED